MNDYCNPYPCELDKNEIVLFNIFTILEDVRGAPCIMYFVQYALCVLSALIPILLPGQANHCCSMIREIFVKIIIIVSIIQTHLYINEIETGEYHNVYKGSEGCTDGWGTSFFRGPGDTLGFVRGTRLRRRQMC